MHKAINSLEGRVLFKCCMRVAFFVEQGLRGMSRESEDL